MEGQINTYLDATVLLNVVNKDEAIVKRILSMVDDENRYLILSYFTELEVYSKLIYCHKKEQANSVMEVFKNCHYTELDRISRLWAENEAEGCGLNAMDALQIACARRDYTEEFVTFEKPTSPLFKVPEETLKVTSLYQTGDSQSDCS
jgi:predicted nucleic acid-binding protein